MTLPMSIDRRRLRHRGPRLSFSLLCVLSGLFLFWTTLSAPGLAAQQAGVIRGQVVDASGEPLPGVTVTLEGEDRSALTDATGRYSFRGLAPGSYSLRTAFLGYSEERSSVTLAAGAVQLRDFVLRTEAVEVEGITVEAQRGILRTIETKRQAPHVVDILDREQLQDLPFQDMVEGFDQLPGVNIQGVSARRGFQNSFIIVRGIQPSLNQVTVDGTPMASTTGDRAVALDVMPGGMASQLEVVKTVTPDMSANVIGGTANIVPLSAFDRRGSFLSLSLQGAGQEETGVLTSDELPLDINVAGSTRLSPTFGIAATGSLTRQTFARTFSQPDDWEIIPQAGFPADLFVPEGTRLEQSQSAFERFSGTVNLDWRPSPSASINWLTSWTESTDDQISTQTEWNYADGKDNIAFQNLGGGLIFSPEGENEKEMDIDTQDERLFLTTLDAELAFSPLTLGLRGSYMDTELDELVNEWSFDSENFASTIDARGRVPWATPQDAAAFANPANYEFDEIDVEPNLRTTEVTHLQADLRYDVGLLGADGFLKVGGVYRGSETVGDRDENQMEFDPASGFSDITLSGLGLEFDAGQVFGLPFGPAINPFLGPDFIRDNPDFLLFNEGASIDDQIEGDYAVDEDVTAGYAMLSGSWGPWQLVGGVRVERTDTRSDFKVFNENTEAITEESEENDYTDILPNLNIRYRIDDRLQLRGAITRTIARANLTQLAGARNIDFDNSDIVGPGVVSDASVEQGNPRLDPFESINLDAAVEFFSRRGSYYTLGVFYKDIDNAIFTQSLEQRNVTLGGTLFQELDFEQPQNAKNGSIFGVEAQLQETFSFLPGALSGFGVGANVALLDSEFDVPGREDEDLPLFQQPDVVLAVRPFFTAGPLRASLSYQYTDDYVVSFGSRPDEDEFFEARETLDAQVSYDLLGSYTLVVGAENLTKADVREFQGHSDRVVGLEEIPRSFWVGLRARFDGFGLGR